MELNKVIETDENPKMIEIYLEQAWQSAFCYALAVEEPKHEWQGAKLLMTIIAGNDSTLQAMKAAVDTGSGGLSFGQGKKDLTDYKFSQEFRMYSDKGKYSKFPITINQNRKAVAIVHDDLLGNGDYILSFDADPGEGLRQILGGGKYGLNILPEWKDIILNEFLRRGCIEEFKFYYDSALFPDGFSIYKLNFSEETGEQEADDIISGMISSGMLKFPKTGTGQAVESIEDLTQYMTTFMDDMVTKVSNKVTPGHDPMTDAIHPQISNYKRELFPVQSHVTTAIAKVLKKQKVALIQGEMSTGKSTMMTAIPDVVAAMSNKKGYFACLMCPPSLTKKWPEEIKEILPHADVRVIERTEQLIEFHRKWTSQGRPKPLKPTFFVISFTTMRGDCAMVPAVRFDYKKTVLQSESNSLPYRFGYYCPSCGNAHQVIESTAVENNEDGEEEEVQNKRTMDEDEFGTSRRLHNSKNPANAFCSECGESLWTKKVPTRYQSIKDWFKYERQIEHALKQNQPLVQQIQLSQPEIPKKVGNPRRIASIEYIRRKMR